MIGYFTKSGLSQSQLKNFAKSPAYYRLKLQKKDEPTEAMLLGSAVHAALLEPEVFAAVYVKGLAFDRRTKAGKEAALAFESDNADKTVLSPGDYDLCLKMRDSVLEHPVVADIFKFDVEAEKEVFWTMQGVSCKAKLDAIVPKISTVIDFKTARFADSKGFMRDAINLHYDLQAYWYSEAYRAEFGDYPRFYAFIVASKEEPFSVGVFEADKEFLDRGKFYADKYLAKYKDCLESDDWPKNESNDVIKLTTPTWALKELMDGGDSYFSGN
jgi:exodeoxyribonuclease VIII